MKRTTLFFLLLAMMQCVVLKAQEDPFLKEHIADNSKEEFEKVMSDIKNSQRNLVRLFNQINEFQSYARDYPEEVVTWNIRFDEEIVWDQVISYIRKNANGHHTVLEHHLRIYQLPGIWKRVANDERRPSLDRHTVQLGSKSEDAEDKLLTVLKTFYLSTDGEVSELKQNQWGFPWVDVNWSQPKGSDSRLREDLYEEFNNLNQLLSKLREPRLKQWLR